MDVCKAVKYPSALLADEGSKLTVTTEYLQTSIEIVNEVGLKLGQTLWRKSNSNSIHAADSHLADCIFEILKNEKWSFALKMGDFVQELAKLKGQHFRREKVLKIMLLNHAQAAKWSGNTELLRDLLASVDWSGSLPEFQMAVEILKENYEKAAEWMVKIGRNSDLMPAHGYVGWPIFREFRSTPQFLEAFRSTFDVDFHEELQKSEGDFTTPIREMTDAE